MTEQEKKVSVGKMKQLIDLNGDTTNFEVKFLVSSVNNAPFKMTIVDQATLDSEGELTYKNDTNGQISGSIFQDKNVYQNYFIVLKADNPCECIVKTIKQEIPAFSRSPPPPPPPPPLPVQQQVPQYLAQPPQSNEIDWLKIGGIILLIVIGYFVYKWYEKNKDKGVSQPVGSQPISSQTVGSSQSNPRPIGSPFENQPVRSQPFLRTRPLTHSQPQTSNLPSDLVDKLKNL